MPQFDISSFIVQLVWLYFSFLTFYFLYSWIYLPFWAFLLKIRKKFQSSYQYQNKSLKKEIDKSSLNMSKFITGPTNKIYF